MRRACVPVTKTRRYVVPVFNSVTYTLCCARTPEQSMRSQHASCRINAKSRVSVRQAVMLVTIGNADVRRQATM